VIGNDSSLLLWAGTLEGWGISVISGTGSIVYGRTVDGKAARAGGWGYRFGDEGSGFAIGTAALRAVAKAADKRGPQTMLTASILRHWGLQQPAELIPHIYGDLPYPQIASLAKLVNHAAEQNDPVARSILMEAARELAEAVKAVYHKLDFQGEIPAALGGGVLSHCDLVKDEMLRLSAEQGVPLQPVEIVMQPVLGAVRMAIAAIHPPL
jgi:N-acetylglucosamine kinase-like BadF-type ATPase